MMAVSEIVGFLHLCFAVFSLLILLFWFWRDYRVDSLRERLFALRQELFDYARAGNVRFDDPAYFKLREIMNGMIRFTHKLTFLRLLLTLAVRTFFPDLLAVTILKEWQDAVAHVPSIEVKQNLVNFHVKMSLIVVRHMAFGSPTFICLTIMFIAWQLLRGATERLMETLVATIRFEFIESHALYEERICKSQPV